MNFRRYTVLCALACLAFAAAAQDLFDVAFKTGPADAILVSGDAALNIRRGDNGSRVARLPAGTHEVHILAGGYITKTVTVDVSGPGLLVEDKLERASSRLRLAAVMPTDRRPKSVEYTPDGKYLVVAPLSGSAVNILDAATGALVASPAPPDKWAKAQGFVESAFPAGRNELWVSQMYTDCIHVFSLSDFSYLRTLKCGGVFPKVILAHPDGRVFVSNWLSETVSVLDGEGTRLASLKARSIPRGLALSADGSILYVANFGDGTIEVFDAAGYERLDVWYDGSDGEPRGGAKRHLVLDKAAGRLYASDMARGSVFVLDLESGKHVAEIAVGPKVNTIALSPDGTRLYVSTRGPNNPVNYEIKGPVFGELATIDTATLKVLDRQWGGNQPTGLAVSPDGTRVVITDFLDHRVELYDVFAGGSSH
ncbi:MAG: beta-propeller fold lactonase family protein [Spirochaetales bacterium]|nr:beta-propeller fold lactonase family protein [Spirochaetales bacterium]